MAKPAGVEELRSMVAVPPVSLTTTSPLRMSANFPSRKLSVAMIAACEIVGPSGV